MTYEPQSTTPDSLPTWTVMVYLAGDNNLSEECIYSLTEMKKADVYDRIKIFVQFDPSDEFLPTQRYRINRPHYYSPPWDPTGALAQDLSDFMGDHGGNGAHNRTRFEHESPNHSMPIKFPKGERSERKGEGGTGDPNMLFNFIAFCVDQRVKTDHYMLIVSGHGAGVMRDYLMKDNRPDGYLTVYDMRRILKRVKKKLKDKKNDRLVIDIFGLDVCLMSMAEISYELRGCVRYALGCESYSPESGWPYAQMLASLNDFGQKPELKTFPQLLQQMVTDYVKFYSPYWLGGLSVNQSALDIGQVEELKRKILALTELLIPKLRDERDKRKKRFAENLRSTNPIDPCARREIILSDALVLSHWKAQSYNGELYVDIADFCDCLCPLVDEPIKAACKYLSEFIKNTFVLKACFSGRKYQYSYGVSIYFPWDAVVPYYGRGIKFPRRSRWLEFLDLYVSVTRRDPRPARDIEFYERIADLNLEGIRMSSDKMSSDKGGNPMHSMRNPPLLFAPDDCMLDPDANAEAQEKLMRAVLRPLPLSEPGEDAKQDMSEGG